MPLVACWLAVAVCTRNGVALGVGQAAPDEALLGAWALGYTPAVTRLDEAWLLDVGTTLRLWGGLPRLVQRLRADWAQWAPHAHLGVATGPTALAALARWRSGLAGWQPGVEAGDAPPPLWDGPELAQLPVHTLSAARPHAVVLSRLGVVRWGQLQRLPRAGVVRRWGAPLLDALDQALGQRPQGHVWLQAQPVFEHTLECSHHLDTAAALLLPARQLLAALQGWLMRQQRGAWALHWQWRHDARRDAPASATLVLRTAQPSADMAHWLRLTTEHLSRLTLAAPVVSLGLRVHEHAPLPHTSVDWLARQAMAEQAPGWTQLVERLQARLGPAAVQGLALHSDHRPEHRQRVQCVVGATPLAKAQSVGSARARALGPALQTSIPVHQPGQPARPDANSPWLQGHAPPHWAPCWLLSPPLGLALRHERPQYQGPLQLLSGPHRLEATQWPDAPTADTHGEVNTTMPEPVPSVQRDYFVARSPVAGLVWVFRVRGLAASEAQANPERHGGWFLHGLFA